MTSLIDYVEIAATRRQVVGGRGRQVDDISDRAGIGRPSHTFAAQQTWGL